MKPRIFAVLSVFPVVLSIFFWPTTFSPSSQVNAQSDRESLNSRRYTNSHTGTNYRAGQVENLRHRHSEIIWRWCRHPPAN